ncbi:MAG TPA: rhodanese-like domain-containing protein, partial [Candidatus Nanopelagicales bacterium]|nr:rhodanese-like domain-containing protein [Candidatus Nanopelagicales bacterium]
MSTEPSTENVWPFLSAAALRDELASDPSPTVLDVRWALTGPPGREQYAAGHVPGAVFVDLDVDLASAPGAGGRHPLPDPETFARAMRRSGVTLDRPVVVTDGSDGSIAARLWWLLTHHGHDHVRVLDGGFAAWAASGGDVAIGDSGAPYDDSGPADGYPFLATAARMPVIDAAAAAALARDGVLLDARAAARYAGEVEPVDPVAGHIPGALSMPVPAAVLGEGGLVVDREELARRFA